MLLHMLFDLRILLIDYAKLGPINQSHLLRRYLRLTKNERATYNAP